MPISKTFTSPFFEDVPPLLKNLGVGFIADHSVIYAPPEINSLGIAQLWNDKQDAYMSINDIVDKGYKVYFVEDDGSQGILTDPEGIHAVPGTVTFQKYWRLIYPPKVNNLTTDIEDQIVISTNYSQTTSSETSSGSEGSLSADIGFLSSSLSASYTTQVSTSQGIENAYAEGEERTKNFTFPAQSAIAVWQKVQAIQIAHNYPVKITSDDLKALNEDLGWLIGEIDDSTTFKPSPVLAESVIVQSFIDCCPASELPINPPIEKEGD